MISILLAKKILQLFLMIFAGLGLVKAKVIKAEDSDVISRVVLYLILPCCIVSTFQIELNWDVVKGLLFTAAAATVMMFLQIGISEIAGKLFHLSVTEKCSIAYPNSGNLIIAPLIAMLLLWLFKVYLLVPHGQTITTIIMMAVAPPSAAIVVQLALLHHEDAEHASVINVMTTLPCIATMPVLLGLYHHLIGWIPH